MKIRLKPLIALLPAICLFAAILTGCNITSRAPKSPTQPGTTQLRQNLVTGPRPGTVVPNTSPGGISTNPNVSNLPGVTRVEQKITRSAGFDTKKAENISKKLNSMKELQKVHTVVYGNTALVGFKMADGLKDPVKARNLVVSTVKNTDKSIANVSASDSGDITTKLTQLTKDVKAGKPINDLTTRFTQLSQAMVPKAG